MQITGMTTLAALTWEACSAVSIAAEGEGLAASWASDGNGSAIPGPVTGAPRVASAAVACVLVSATGTTPPKLLVR